MKNGSNDNMQNHSVKPVDLALIAVNLSAKSGKRASDHLADAVDLLARSVAMVSEVDRKVAQLAARRPADRISVDNVAKSLDVTPRTVRSHLKEMGREEKDLSTAYIPILRERIDAAKSRKKM